jgi:serine/threonine-protein kinase
MLEKVAALDIPMCVPVEFGTCDDGVYNIQSWINGEDLETVLPTLPETEQYILGLRSGEIARKMHTISAPETQEEWETRFNRKTDMKIKKYHECGLRFDGDEHILAYIEQNRHLLKNRPQCFQHGDYHVGNMMVENGELKIIDFDRYDFGDPWEEFNRIVWSAAASPHFATGQLRGYFGGEPPMEFFKLLAFYIASNTLSSIYWAVPFGQSDLDTMMKQAQDVLTWFDNMQNPVPTWYLDNFYIQWIDGVPYKLKAPFDFSFLGKYGKVFKVFDNQGSGNICFGVEDGENKYFIKFAGAPTDNYSGKCEDAIERLKRAVPAYRDLAHPNLIRLIKDEETGGGYAVIFEWVDAVHMWMPDGGQEFKRLPTEKHHDIFEGILSFHANMVEKEYSALDFYEDHIMWDSKNEKAVICDIDFYSKGWYEGMSGIWNPDCEWYSPEQYIDGAAIDEVSCVYVMGVTAFALFGNGKDRSIEKWRLSKNLFDVAKRAVNAERSDRQQTIEQFITEWRAAIG